MAQFDVHRAPPRVRAHTPFVVVIQSRYFDESANRVVVPLVSSASAPAEVDPRFNPRFLVLDEPVVLHPLQITSVPVERLGPVVAALEDDGDRIIDAIDLLISRAWG